MYHKINHSLGLVKIWPVLNACILREPKSSLWSIFNIKANKPWSHGDDLVCFDPQIPLLTGGVTLQCLVHQEEELLYPLILPQVFPTLHKIVILSLVIPANCYPLRLTYWGHYFYLSGNVWKYFPFVVIDV